jgi:hypothetical protein
MMTRRPRGSRLTHYHNMPQHTEISIEDPNFFPVNTFYTKHEIAVCGRSFFHTHRDPAYPTQQTFKQFYQAQPKSIQDICGKVVFPSDNGHSWQAITV